MPTERYKVRVTKDHLVFCCGHFISYDGDKCERLHGHNYRTAVEVEGPLDENYYVFDFIALKKRTKEITDELDHHMLLATQTRSSRSRRQPTEVRVTYKDREWVFPRERLRPAADREHHRRAAGALHRWAAAESLKTKEQFIPDVMRILKMEEGPGSSTTVEWRGI